MSSFPRFALMWTVAAIATLAPAQHASTQLLGAVSVTAGHDTGVDALRQWDVAVDRMTRSGGLVVTSRLDDRTLPGRAHEYLAQVIDDLPVFGGGISR